MKFLDVLPWYYRAAAIAAIFAAGVALGWEQGDEHGTQKLIDYVGKQATETVRLGRGRTVVLERVTTKWHTVIEQVFVKGETIEKEVPKHVTQEDDRRCVVPIGFVRSYDAAVANDRDPGAAGVDERAASGIPLSVVAETDAFNLTLGHAWRKRAAACIEAYNAVRRVK
jgi:hypothetical protein